MGYPQPLKNATVYWAGIQSKVTTQTDEIGFAKSPYKKPVSSRFIVHAKGYLPAVGYLVAGKITPVIMYRAYLLKSLINTLNFEYDPSLSMLLGKILDQNHKSLKDAEVESSADIDKQTFYSLGALGLFHNSANTTGVHGDFFIPGIDPWDTNYLLPSLQKEREHKIDLPATVVDMSHIPKASSLTLETGSEPFIESQVLDAYSRRSSGAKTQIVVAGQRDVYTTNQEGQVALKLEKNRSAIDVIEVLSPSYLNTWINSPANPKVFPPYIYIFTLEQVRHILGDHNSDYDLQQGIVVWQSRYQKLFLSCKNYAW